MISRDAGLKQKHAEQEVELIDKIDERQIGDYWEDKKEELQKEELQKRVEAIRGKDTAHLYAGIEKYQQSYETKIEQLQSGAKSIVGKLKGEKPLSLLKKIKIGKEREELAKAQHTYFREKFVAYLNQRILDDGKRFQGDVNLRASDPKQATIMMDDLLGKEGTLLYKLALEEEMNSEAYMDAVLNKSTEEYKGTKWTERPIIIVGGPSGSGKSFAAKSVVEHCESDIKKDSTSKDNINYVISVDGGVAREVSQMRKMVIRVSIDKGFTGIKDLHKQSKLEKVKTRIKKHVLRDDCPHGVVIPETFSSFPWGGRKLLTTISKLRNTYLIFARVVGKNDETFKETVNKMGNNRAWEKRWGYDLVPMNEVGADGPEKNKLYVQLEKDGFSYFMMGMDQSVKIKKEAIQGLEEISLEQLEKYKPEILQITAKAGHTRKNFDMNRTDNLAEAKNYGAAGFNPGKYGSILASKFFNALCQSMGKACQTLRVVNSLLVKTDPITQKEVIISEEALTELDNWKPSKGVNVKPTLTEYAKNKRPPRIYSNEEYEAQHTLEILQEEISNRLKTLKEKNPNNYQNPSAKFYYDEILLNVLSASLVNGKDVTPEESLKILTLTVQSAKDSITPETRNLIQSGLNILLDLDKIQNKDLAKSLEYKEEKNDQSHGDNEESQKPRKEKEKLEERSDIENNSSSQDNTSDDFSEEEQTDTDDEISNKPQPIKKPEPTKQPSFLRKYGPVILTSTLTGMGYGFLGGAALGVAGGIFGAIPSGGISLLATPVAIVILGGAGAVLGGLIGLSIGLTTSLIDHVKSAKKPVSGRESEGKRLLNPEEIRNTKDLKRSMSINPPSSRSSSSDSDHEGPSNFIDNSTSDNNPGRSTGIFQSYLANNEVKIIDEEKKDKKELTPRTKSK